MDSKLRRLLDPYVHSDTPNIDKPKVSNQFELPADTFEIPESLKYMITQERENSMGDKINTEASSPTLSSGDNEDNHLIRKLLCIWILSSIILYAIYYAVNLIRDESEYRQRLQSNSNGWISTLNHVIKKMVKKGRNKDQKTDDYQSDQEEELLFDRRKFNKDEKDRMGKKKKGESSKNHDTLEDKSSDKKHDTKK